MFREALGAIFGRRRKRPAAGKRIHGAAGRRGVFEVLEDRRLLSINHAPVLDTTGQTILPPVVEGQANPAALIEQIVGNRITDADPGAVQGIAVIQADNLFGDWQFSRDNGATWQELSDPAYGGVNQTEARLLPADGQTRLRYVPQPNCWGTTELLYQAWDQTSYFVAGGFADARDNSGGSFPFSTGVATAALTSVPAVGLTANTVLEHSPIGTVVGNFLAYGASHPEYSYSLVSGPGDSGNALFTIANGQLITASSQFDYSQGPWTYTVRVEIDQLAVDEIVRVSVGQLDQAPTDLYLSAYTLAPNQPVGTTVATIGTQDPNVYDQFSYQLVAGPGSDDNGAFTISNNLLIANAVFDGQAQGTYHIRVRSTDNGGLSLEKPLTLTVLTASPATGLTPYRVFTWLPTDQPSQFVEYTWREWVWNDPTAAGQALENFPAGERVLIVPASTVFDAYTSQPENAFQNPADAIYDPAQDGAAQPTAYWGFWLDHGLEYNRQRAVQYFQAMKDAGLTSLDALVLDFEGQSFNYWTAQGLPSGLVRAIRSDPRYADFIAQFREIFPELGPGGQPFDFTNFWADPSWAIPGPGGLTAMQSWQSFIASWYDSLLEEAVYSAAKQVFPNVICSNYGNTGVSLADASAVRYLNLDYTPADVAQNPAIGLQAPMLNGLWSDYASPSLYGTLGYEGSYANFQWLVNSVRASYVEYPNLPVIPWVADRSVDYPGTVEGTDYWQEMLIQSMLSTGSTNAFCFNPNLVQDPVTGAYVANSAGQYEAVTDVPYFDAALQGLQALAPDGFFVDHPVDMLDYSQNFAVSYAKTDTGRIVGRVTFNAGTDQATFNVGNLSITVSRYDGVAPGQPAPLGQYFVIDPPSAAADSYTTPENAALVVSTAGVLANDTDPAERSLQATIVAGPTHGSLQLAPDGTFTYTPNPGFLGTDHFTYRAANGATSSQPADVAITVAAPPETAVALSVNLDADGNGTADALSDGVLILRYLFDPQGQWNVSDALGSGATRTTPAEIKSYLDSTGTTLDADGNGTVDALTDGILILRYLFDPTGNWNVADALGSGATRTTDADVQAYLDQFNPGLSAAPAAASSLSASAPTLDPSVLELIARSWNSASQAQGGQAASASDSALEALYGQGNPGS